ncbi:hypothetical protein [Singulisphaera acidiphila]|uniref:Uncharacterized protein n=1 Tax=Singulisphaera acidiphila (strain ATCC BAA-1392 / DSM 18658 / VKM B-2454 / MOB10) TaxID=886293 RepID=L0DG74_SINAD|nr:hypothetical protein [Singulisphaera acidiphila]AGA28359.1 hypothetical protein Sinac_4151 [Singulisphaera acidiphila DSM 18658]
MLPAPQLIVLSIVSFAPVADEKTSAIVDANKSAINSIMNYQCNVALTVDCGKSPRRLTSKYWRDSIQVRISQNSIAGNLIEVQIVGGKLTAMTGKVATGGSSTVDPEGGWIIAPDDRRIVDTDPWELSLFVLPVGLYRTPPYPMYTLADLAVKGKLEAFDETLEGHKVVRITASLPAENRTYTVWCDEAKNWMIRKAVHVIKDGKGDLAWDNQYVVEQFDEVQPSIFVPSKITSISKYKGSVACKSVADLSEIRINQPSFRLPPMPPAKAGTTVMDEIKGTVHVIGNNGTAKDRPKRLSDAYSPPLEPETPPPPVARTQWIGGILALVTAGGLAAIAVVRRLRRR